MKRENGGNSCTLNLNCQHPKIRLLIELGVGICLHSIAGGMQVPATAAISQLTAYCSVYSFCELWNTELYIASQL